MSRFALVLISASLSFVAGGQPQWPPLTVTLIDHGKDHKEGDVPGKVAIYVNGQEVSRAPERRLPNWYDLNVQVDDGAQVRLVAQDTGDWVFVRWNVLPTVLLVQASKEGAPASVEALEANPEISYIFSAKGGGDATAEFSHRPGGETLDLVANYKAFLEENKIADDALTLVDPGERGPMPGIAAIAILDASMRLYTRTSRASDSVDPVLVWENYRKNLKELEKALPMASPSAKHVIAAFAMTGSCDYERWHIVEALVKKSYGVDIDDAHFETSGCHWFGGNGDANHDLVSNAEEWKAALEKAGPDATMERKLQIFTEMAVGSIHSAK